MRREMVSVEGRSFGNETSFASLQSTYSVVLQLLCVVDLGALEGVAGVDVDGLPGGVEVECA